MQLDAEVDFSASIGSLPAMSPLTCSLSVSVCVCVFRARVCVTSVCGITTTALAALAAAAAASRTSTTGTLLFKGSVTSAELRLNSGPQPQTSNECFEH